MNGFVSLVPGPVSWVLGFVSWLPGLLGSVRNCQACAWNGQLGVQDCQSTVWTSQLGDPKTVSLEKMLTDNTYECSPPCFEMVYVSREMSVK